VRLGVSTRDAKRRVVGPGAQAQEGEMSTSKQGATLLTVRGTLIPESLEAARRLHNETAGSARGIAAARALGDLSHNVYVALGSPQTSAAATEVLFLDRWDSPAGIFQFFSNPEVQHQGDRLFSKREGTVWTPACGSFSYCLPVPKARGERYVGMIRGAIHSPEHAIAVFADDSKAQRDARRRGIASHELFIKVSRPATARRSSCLGSMFGSTCAA
jgi:hypothetical protein